MKRRTPAHVTWLTHNAAPWATSSSTASRTSALDRKLVRFVRQRRQWEHRLIGRLQRRWGFFFWITEATADTYWEHDEDEIRAYPAFDCGSDNTRAWRNRSTGEVVAKDGRRSIRVHNSESNITEDCDV